MERVKLDLLRVDGNAYSLLGAFAAKAREQGWDEPAIEGVQAEAMSGNYKHLVQTLMDHTDLPPEQMMYLNPTMLGG